MTEPTSQSDAPETAAPAPTVTFFKRSTKNRSSIRKRPVTPPPATSDSSDAYSSSDEKATGTRGVKKRRKNKSVVTTETTSKPSSATLGNLEDVKRTYTDVSSELTNANDATKTNWHNHGDETASLSSSKKTAEGEEGPIVGGTYKGTSSYTSFIKKSENAPARSVGPMKAPSNIRTITITDYAPDVCKDYKQTGFCGFGDTCKFLHAREDYAQGWKLDRDWEINQKTGKARNKKEDDSKGEDEEEKELKDIPFKCVICKGDYKSPIVTKCKHYFCETCAISRYKKTPNCAICGRRTDGAFSMAKELRKKLERKAAREEERSKKEEEEAAAEGN